MRIIFLSLRNQFAELRQPRTSAGKLGSMYNRAVLAFCVHKGKLASVAKELPKLRGGWALVLYRRLMQEATQAAPKPLSMLTTGTLEGQELCMPRGAARPPKLAP